MISKIKQGVNIIEKPIKKNKALIRKVQVTIKKRPVGAASPPGRKPYGLEAAAINCRVLLDS
ncbi:MAG: hypothetical protein JRF47_15650 [Deltaproteobacteria bacterium]|jgi:hypothetical protein|nr:hypothetical protein [Deltaproteobacteria bacterium]